MPKPIVALFFGGEVANHDLSFATGQTIAAHLPRSRYTVVPVHVTTEGMWQVPLGALPTQGNTNQVIERLLEAVAPVSPRHGLERLLEQPVAAFFSVLRGPGGDDGALSSLAHTYGIAAVGSPTSVCAVTSQKHHLQKVIDDIVATPHTRFFSAYAHPEYITQVAHEEFTSPFFIKPAAQEGSYGVMPVHDYNQLAGIVRHSRTNGLLLQEQAPGQEAVVTLFEDEHGKVHTLPVALITPQKTSFYSDTAKRYPGYVAVTTIDDATNLFVVEAVAAAHDVYVALGCQGIVSVDMMIGQGGPYVLEVNTVPTFTAHTPLVAQLKASHYSPSAVLEATLTRSLGVNA